MRSDTLTILLAIITTVPALAWHVNAFINIKKFYSENKREIQNKTQEHLNKVKEGAKQVQAQAEKLSEQLEHQVKEGLGKKEGQE